MTKARLDPVGTPGKKGTADHLPGLHRAQCRLSVFHLPPQETGAAKKAATASV